MVDARQYSSIARHDRNANQTQESTMLCTILALIFVGGLVFEIGADTARRIESDRRARAEL